MRDDPLIGILAVFVPFSFAAVGGALSIFAGIQHEVVDVRHWLTGREFVEIFAVSRAAPGPGSMLVTLVALAVRRNRVLDRAIRGARSLYADGRVAAKVDVVVHDVQPLHLASLRGVCFALFLREPSTRGSKCDRDRCASSFSARVSVVCVCVRACVRVSVFGACVRCR